MLWWPAGLPEEGKSAEGGSTWRNTAPSTCSQLFTSSLRVLGSPGVREPVLTQTPTPTGPSGGGCFQRAAAEFQGTATLALLAFYSHLFCWPLGASRPPTSGILALIFSCSVARWPPNPSPSCSSLLSCHCPLCTRLPSLLPLPQPIPLPLPAHHPSVSTFLWALHHGRKYQWPRRSTRNYQVLLSEARIRGLESSGESTPGPLSLSLQTSQGLPEAPAAFLSSSVPHHSLRTGPSTVFGHSVASWP